MAGAKGRSGGARPNSGGARPGAGRKPKAPAILTLAATYDDPEKFLRAVMNDSETPAKTRVDAAKALMPYTHGKLPAKKPEAPAKSGSGRFGMKAPPKLVVNNR